MLGDKIKTMQGDGSIIDLLMKKKLMIAAVLIILLLCIGSLSLFQKTRAQDAVIMQKETEYNTLVDQHNQLVDTYNKLTTDYNDLNGRYGTLSDDYNILQNQRDELQKNYNNYRAGVDDFLEDDRYIAYNYWFGTQRISGSDKKVLEVKAFNVGDEKAGRVYVKARIKLNDAVSVNEREFKDMNSMGKGFTRWEMDNNTELLQVWVESY